MNKAHAAHVYYDNINTQKNHSFEGIGLSKKSASSAKMIREKLPASPAKNAGRSFIGSLKDPGSALTHLIGAIFALIGTVPLTMKAIRFGTATAVIAMLIFMGSMILLYSASTTYHSVDATEKINLLLRRIDHAMIFVLIAGSYTPVCLLVLPPSKGIPLLITVWSFATVGIILKIFIIKCPKWISSVIYIAMGWLCVLVFGPLLESLTPEGFGLLLAGGIFYTAGGILYGLKLKIFDRLPANFGKHEIFHVFVMAGSLCHYLYMFRCIL